MSSMHAIQNPGSCVVNFQNLSKKESGELEQKVTGAFQRTQAAMPEQKDEPMKFDASGGVIPPERMTAKLVMIDVDGPDATVTIKASKAFQAHFLAELKND